VARLFVRLTSNTTQAIAKAGKTLAVSRLVRYRVKGLPVRARACVVFLSQPFPPQQLAGTPLAGAPASRLSSPRQLFYLYMVKNNGPCCRLSEGIFRGGIIAPAPLGTTPRVPSAGPVRPSLRGEQRRPCCYELTLCLDGIQEIDIIAFAL